MAKVYLPKVRKLGGDEAVDMANIVGLPTTLSCLPMEPSRKACMARQKSRKTKAARHGMAPLRRFMLVIANEKIGLASPSVGNHSSSLVRLSVQPPCVGFLLS